MIGLGRQPCSLHLLLLLLVAFYNLVGADKKRSKVLEATSRRIYNEALKKHERVLVQLSVSCQERHAATLELARPCEAIQRFEPEFQSIADQLRAAGLRTKLVSVTIGTTSDTMHGIEQDFRDLFNLKERDDYQKLPLLVYFVHGKRFAVYDGRPLSAPMVTWLSTRELSAVSEIAEENVTAYANKAAEGSFVLLARVKPGSARAKMFWSAVEAELLHDRGVRFLTAVVRLPDAADGNRASSLSMVVPSHGGFDKSEYKFSGSWTEASIVKWALKRTYPPVGSRFDAVLHAATRLKRAGLDGIVVLLLDEELVFDPGRQQMTDRLTTLVKQHQQWRFLVIELSLLAAGGLEAIGITALEPACVLVLTESRRYRLAGADVLREQSAISDFLARVKSKKEAPWFRSESASDQHSVAPVQVLTGRGFDSFVLDESKDVVVLFHTRACGEECSSGILPVLQELASQQQWSSVRFATFDTSKNDCREDVSRLPKVVLYPAVTQEYKMELRKVVPAHAHADLKKTKAFLLLHARSLVGLPRQEL
mmetsp:Transcript_18645/g.41602  ORF Transcript_18645/g.41602 Transcript_18645/m.41602 type:complete len:538 (+) Transcript_18645:44-1657(+)